MNVAECLPSFSTQQVNQKESKPKAINTLNPFMQLEKSPQKTN